MHQIQFMLGQTHTADDNCIFLIHQQLKNFFHIHRKIPEIFLEIFKKISYEIFSRKTSLTCSILDVST